VFALALVGASVACAPTNLTPFLVGCSDDADCARGEECIDARCSVDVTEGGAQVPPASDNEPGEDLSDEDVGDCLAFAFEGDVHHVCTVPRTWAAARDLCTSLGEHLLDLEDNGSVAADLAEESAVQSNLVLRGITEAWMGLNDLALEGSLRWEDNRPLSETGASRFAAGEPNDFGSEDCVETLPTGGWNDAFCTVGNATICEDGASRPTPPADCVRQTVNGKSYTFCRQPRTFAASEVLCGGLGAKMLAFDDNGSAAAAATERNAVHNAEVALALGLRSWVGLDDRVTEGSFVWGGSGTRLDAALSAFVGGEPSNTGGEDCMQVRTSQWNDLGCAALRPAICEE
jgi:hypothetical protein